MKKLKEIVLAEQIQKLNEKKFALIGKLNEQIRVKQKELRQVCTHSQNKIVDENIEGGYLNVAEYNKITECAFCGEELSRKTTYGSYA